MRMNSPLYFLLLILGFWEPFLQAQELPRKIKAPPLRNVALTELPISVSFDQLLLYPEWDSIFFIQGSDLVQFHLLKLIEEQRISQEIFLGRELVAVFPLEEKLFVLLNEISSTLGRVPLLYEIQTQQMIELSPPDIHLIPGGYFGITTQNISSTQQSVLLRLSYGGIEGVNLRLGNHPAYCLVHFSSGEVQHFPPEWDPCYLSADGQIVVFEKAYKNDFKPRALVGFDMDSGQELKSFPHFRQEPVELYSWTQTSRSKMLCQRDQESDADYLWGFRDQEDLYSVFPFSLRLPPPSLFQINGSDSAFVLRKDSTKELWMASLTETPPSLKKVSESIEQFCLLKHGVTVFSDGTQVNSGMHILAGAYVYHYATHQFWNLSEDLALLPPLTPQQSSFIFDLQSVEIVEGFGSRRETSFLKWAYARLEHCQMEGSVAFFTDHDRFDRKEIQYHFLISSEGSRALLSNLNRSGTQEVLLHNSGLLILKEKESPQKTGLLKFYRIEGID